MREWYSKLTGVAKAAIATITASVLALILWPTMAFAQETGGTAGGDDFLTLAPSTVQIVVAFLIPFAVGLLSKATWPGYIKGGISIVLNFANAAIVAATLVDGGAAWSETTLRNALIGLAVSLASFYNVFKPANLVSGFQPNGTPGKLNNVLVK
jgi:predicted Na+-dependent transporter